MVHACVLPHNAVSVTLKTNPGVLVQSYDKEGEKVIVQPLPVLPPPRAAPLSVQPREIERHDLTITSIPPRINQMLFV